VHHLSVVCRVGLGDPADTGILFALVGPAILLFRLRLPYDLRVEPVFAGDAVFEAHSSVRLRVHPVSLVSPLVRFIFSSDVLKAVWPMVLQRWRR
jgi:hypothetical protein